MANQAKDYELNGAHRSPPSAVASNISELAHDAILLTELQSRLVLLDSRSCFRQIRFPIVLAAIGAVVALSAFPVFITATAHVLVEFANFPESAALAAAATVALLAGAGAIIAGYLMIRNSLATFERSQQEFARNVKWLKRVLKQGGAPVVDPAERAVH